jgi:NADPH:quinone reductase-like Zn-dependent oxidoreductase
LTDCFVRQGQWWRKDELPLPNTPGVDFVGKLYRIDVTTSKRLGLSVGDRVMSLVKWGGNTRFLSVDPTSLVKVPETIDPASAVCLAETYLAAFQVLHQGQRGTSRYRMGSLNNKSILIVCNAVTTIGRAICDIAFDGGATRVYALAEQNHNQELTAIGVSPLIGDAERWRPSLVGNVDCIVCLEESIDPALYPLLKPNGQAVLIRFKDFVEQTSTLSVNAFSETKSCWKKQLHNKIVAYNIFEEWENNKDLCIKDMQHLVNLLVQTRIAPRVLDRIPLSKVARAQELVASARLSGIMVCEPWLIGKSRTVCL